MSVGRLNKRSIRTLDIDRCLQEYGHSPEKMLDVGHGDGVIANHYTVRGVDVIGIEVNELFVEKASQRFPEAKFILYDGKYFPFEDLTFDTIILNDVLEHISYESIESVMSEVRRVLTFNGVVYISVMSRWQVIEPHSLIPLLTWLPRIAWNSVCNRLINQDYVGYYPYTRKKVRELLERHQFKWLDLTRVYVTHKIYGVNPVGDRFTARLMSILKRLRLLTILYYLALRVSVLLFVARREALS